VSLENVRRHWRFLATMLVIFVAVAAAGPLIFYGVRPLASMIFESFGGESVLVMALLFTVFSLGWLFFVLCAFHRADRNFGKKRDGGADADG